MGLILRLVQSKKLGWILLVNGQGYACGSRQYCITVGKALIAGRLP